MPQVILSEEVAKEFGKLQGEAEKNDGEARYLLKIINKGVSKLALNPQIALVPICWCELF